MGASALDHDNDADPVVAATRLQPGESLSIELVFRWLSVEQAAELEREILAYNLTRITTSQSGSSMES